MKTIPLLAALVLEPAAYSQTADQQELCRIFAGIQRNFAELRDSGVSRQKAKDFQREMTRKLKFNQELSKALLDAIDRTYSLGWSPNVTEVAAYAACLDGFRNP